VGRWAKNYRTKVLGAGCKKAYPGREEVKPAQISYIQL
jgi:hypothetical protein